jgi:hypothetical protein
MTLEVRQDFVPIAEDGLTYTATIWQWTDGQIRDRSSQTPPASHVPGLRACYVNGCTVTLEAFLDAVTRLV